MKPISKETEDNLYVAFEGLRADLNSSIITPEQWLTIQMETLKSLPDEIDSMSPVEAESLICKSILLNNRGIFKNEIDGKPVSKWSIILQNQLDNELEYNIKPKLRQPTAPTGKPTLKGFQSSLSINQIDRLYNSLQGVYIDNSSVNFDICI